MTEGDVENVTDVVLENLFGKGDEINVLLELVGNRAYFERLCSDDRFYESKPLCSGSFYDYMNKFQAELSRRPEASGALVKCFLKGELKTGSTSAKPLDIIAPELDEEYISYFKN